MSRPGSSEFNTATHNSTAGGFNIKATLGFSIGPRYSGAALSVGGMPVYLQPARGYRARGLARPEALTGWFAEVLLDYPDGVLAFDEATVPDAFLAYAEERGLPALLVPRADLRPLLGCRAVTNVAICREFTRRYQFIVKRAGHVWPARRDGGQPEKERYWEPAIVAAATACAAFELFAHTGGLDVSPPKYSNPNRP